MRYKRKGGGKSTSSLALDCVDEVMFDGKPRTVKEIFSEIWDLIKRTRAAGRRRTGSTSIPTKTELWNYFYLHPEYEKVSTGIWKYTGEIPVTHLNRLRNRRRRRINRIQKILR